METYNVFVGPRGRCFRKSRGFYEWEFANSLTIKNEMRQLFNVLATDNDIICLEFKYVPKGGNKIVKIPVRTLPETDYYVVLKERLTRGSRFFDKSNNHEFNYVIDCWVSKAPKKQLNKLEQKVDI